jgi:hypothetical protein
MPAHIDEMRYNTFLKVLQQFSGTKTLQAFAQVCASKPAKAKNLRTEVEQTLKRRVPISIRMGPKLGKTKPTIRLLGEIYFAI